MKPYKQAITYGTFALFHIGHLYLLERIKEISEELIVAVSSDTFNTLKDKTCVIPFEDRKHIIAALKVVDQVIDENDWEQKIEDVQKFNCDLFVMGDDWKGKFDFLASYCRVLYLPRTDGVSFSEIKTLIQK